MFLELRDISKRFDSKVVLDSVSLDLEEGEIVVLLGPSGCGKTTLLRIVAGLETADSGSIRAAGQDLHFVPVHQRGFGLVFQDYALFPHKNVSQNVAFGLRMLGWSKADIEARVDQVLGLVGLAGFSERAIHDLSGGEQQRVALARSLAPAPRLLLLDEPLGALDRALRERLMLDLRDILKRAGGTLGQANGITAVYVTHDQAEAFAIADRVVVMNQGRIEQTGSPTELYAMPRTPFVASFLGMENLLKGTVLALSPLVVRTSLGDLEISDPLRAARAGHSCTILIRPEAAELGSTGANGVRALLRDVSFRGRYKIATLDVAGDPPATLKLEFDSKASLPPVGAVLQLSLESSGMVLLESS